MKFLSKKHLMENISIKNMLHNIKNHMLYREQVILFTQVSNSLSVNSNPGLIFKRNFKHTKVALSINFEHHLLKCRLSKWRQSIISWIDIIPSLKEVSPSLHSKIMQLTLISLITKALLQREYIFLSLWEVEYCNRLYSSQYLQQIRTCNEN